jgi:sulfinoalanine decarboxylase/sulfinoalanine decarboxylase/aspartate 1-decarboxylase
MSELKSTLSLFNDLFDYLIAEEEANPVAARIEAKSLYDAIDLSLNYDPILDTEFEKVLKEVIVATPKTATHLFFNQLFGGRQPKAILGDLLSILFNNSMYTYKVAGPHVGIEQEIIRKSCERLGYRSESNGTFPTGGSMSNYMGLIMGRDRKDPDSRNKGVRKNLVIYTSAESHYSTSKNASFAGIGRENVRYIPANDAGQMDVSFLKQLVKVDVEKGFIPTLVNATAGTTVLGAFDPFHEIADICKEYDMWMHVDGAYCGAILFSDQYQRLLDGAERSDSFSYNAHKMLGTPLTCSVILVNDKKHLRTSFSNDADYLYQTDGDDFNLGKTSFQCGRKNDALKFWTLWKSIGRIGLEKIIDKQFILADVARDYVRNNPNYTDYSIDDSVSICFNYKNISANTLCTLLYQHQITVVGFGAFQDNEFVRLVTVNANNTEEDILYFFKVLEDFVEKNSDLFDSYKD